MMPISKLGAFGLLGSLLLFVSFASMAAPVPLERTQRYTPLKPTSPSVARWDALRLETEKKGGSAEYTLTMSEENWHLAKIEANFVLHDSLLLMLPGLHAEHLKDGWATYVENLSASDEVAQPVHVNYIGDARWAVPGQQGRRLQINYEVYLGGGDYNVLMAAGSPEEP